MTVCPSCPRAVASGDSLPCGREPTAGIADHLLQLNACEQQLIDAIQGGRDGQAAIVARVVARIAQALASGAPLARQRRTVRINSVE